MTDLNKNYRDTPPTKTRSDKLRRKRTFVRGVLSERYTLTERRQSILAGATRVLTPKISVEAHDELTFIDPGDEPFRTQSLHCHFTTIAPGGWNQAHGHQNEAFFYILEGRGFEMHDGIRYDWEVGDAVAV